MHKTVKMSIAKMLISKMPIYTFVNYITAILPKMLMAKVCLKWLCPKCLYIFNLNAYG
jgi:hypothetical protein